MNKEHTVLLLIMLPHRGHGMVTQWSWYVVVAGRLLQAILICSILFYDILFILSYFRIRIDNLSIKFALKWVNAQ